MRRRLWIAVPLAILVLGTGAAWFLRAPDSVTLETYQKIRIGMTPEEVVDLMGGPGEGSIAGTELISMTKSDLSRKKAPWRT